MSVLSKSQLDQFIRDGFIRIDGALPRELADEGRAILWRDTGCDPNDPATWTRPVIRLGIYGQEPFAKAANTPILHQAFDQLVGKGAMAAASESRDFSGAVPVAGRSGGRGMAH